MSQFCLPLWFQVRLVSNRILSTADADIESDREFTFMLTIFGQWVDHDLTFTPTSPSIRSFSYGINCDESCERSEPCFPIPVSQGLSLCQGLSHSCFCIITVFDATFNVWTQAPPGDQRPEAWHLPPFFPLITRLWFWQHCPYVWWEPQSSATDQYANSFPRCWTDLRGGGWTGKGTSRPDQWWRSSTCQWSVPWQWTRAPALYQSRKQNVCHTSENP